MTLIQFHEIQEVFKSRYIHQFGENSFSQMSNTIWTNADLRHLKMCLREEKCHFNCQAMLLLETDLQAFLCLKKNQQNLCKYIFHENSKQ